MDQHIAILPDIVMPTAEITIGDIQVGDPGVPLTKDQALLRQLIWINKQFLIGKGNALPPAARWGRYAILTWAERARSRREYDQ